MSDKTVTTIPLPSGELLHELLVRNHIPPLCPPHDGHLDQAAAEFSRPYRERIAELEKRLAELAATPTVDGKTPGEVLILAQHGCRPSQVSREMLESAERDALAVLRAFGQPGQTTQANTVEALRRVRERIKMRAEGSKEPILFAYDLAPIIDDELAKLEAKPAPTSDHVHEIGSCSYCDKGGNGNANHDERKP